MPVENLSEIFFGGEGGGGEVMTVCSRLNQNSQVIVISRPSLHSSWITKI